MKPILAESICVRLAASRVVRNFAAVTGRGLVNIANGSPLPDYPKNRRSWSAMTPGSPPES